jgi:hypothetical protein
MNPTHDEASATDVASLIGLDVSSLAQVQVTNVRCKRERLYARWF